MAPPSSSAKMQLSRGQIETLYLAGTVSIPRHFPELGRIWYWPPGAVRTKNPKHKSAVIRVEQRLSRGVTVTRSCLLDDISAIFLPANPDCVELFDGDLLLTEEIEAAWAKITKGSENAVLGIVYVAEAARVLTEISMGMTAAQSADYVPPVGPYRLPDHYALTAAQRCDGGGLGSAFCDPGIGCDP